MRQRAMVIGLLGVLVWSWADAASIQYLLSTGEVRGTSDAPIPDVPGYGVVTIPEPMDSIIWPVPAMPAGYTGGTCPVGSGRPEWTRIADPGAVTVNGGGMATNTEMVGFFFATSETTILPGCHLVFAWTELRTLLSTAIVSAVGTADPLVLAFNTLNQITEVSCPASNNSANCNSARASMTSLNNVYYSPAALNTFTGNIVEARDDAVDFKAVKLW